MPGHVFIARHVYPQAESGVAADNPVCEKPRLLRPLNRALAPITSSRKRDYQEVAGLLYLGDLYGVTSTRALQRPTQWRIERLLAPLHRIQTHHRSRLRPRTPSRVQNQREPPMVACVLPFVVFQVLVYGDNKSGVLRLEQPACLPLGPILHVLPALLTRRGERAPQLLEEVRPEEHAGRLLVALRWYQKLAQPREEIQERIVEVLALAQPPRVREVDHRAPETQLADRRHR
mmetsp:Transcript_84344/g.223442  ORF Transcript_84344/g.223442 Transcript_84344/m.223442 type:complete len:232 (-) Transcript_84344:127-822(-)